MLVLEQAFGPAGNPANSANLPNKQTTAEEAMRIMDGMT